MRCPRSRGCSRCGPSIRLARACSAGPRASWPPRFAACPLHIQCSHFLATDVTLTLLVLLALDACVALAEQGRPRDALLAGALIGLALATKVSAAPLAGAARGRARAPRGRARSVAAGLALLARSRPRSARPAVRGSLVRRVLAAGGRAGRDGAATPARCPTRSSTSACPGTRTTCGRWRCGAWARRWGGGRCGQRVARCGALRAVRPAGALVLAAWVVPYVLLTGAFDVKYPRYLLPVYPILILWAAAWLWDARASRVGRRLLLPCRGHGGVSRLAFLAVYRGPAHVGRLRPNGSTRTCPRAATLLTQHWDEGFPLPSAGRDPPRAIAWWTSRSTSPTRRASATTSRRELADADSPSCCPRGGSWARSRARPGRFPLTNRFYRLLFAGRLGFELVHEQSARPRLGRARAAGRAGGRVDQRLRPPEGARLPEGARPWPRARSGAASSTRTRAGRDAPGPARVRPHDAGPARARLRPRAGPAGRARGSCGGRWWWRHWRLAAYALAAPWLPRAGGFALARVLGLLLLAWPAWWLGYLFERSFTAGDPRCCFRRRRRPAGGPPGARRGLRWPAEGSSSSALFWGALRVRAGARGQPGGVLGREADGLRVPQHAHADRSLPPPEPWFAGSILHYTWFGHFVAAALGKLVRPASRRHLQPRDRAVGALAVSGAYRAGRDRGAQPAHRPAGGGPGRARPATWRGRVELWRRRRGPVRRVLGRLARGAETINEYPLWSVLFADLHAHVLVLPFTLGVPRARRRAGAVRRRGAARGRGWRCWRCCWERSWSRTAGAA